MLPSRIQIPTAVAGSRKKFYTQEHYTTLTFMRPRPVYAREYVPKRHQVIDLTNFIRCNPLSVPAFGKCKIHNYAFYVPYRCVFPAFNQMIASVPFTDGGAPSLISLVPILRNDTIVEFFLDQSLTYQLLQVSDSSSYDVIIYDTNGTRLGYYLFTSYGLEVYSILLSLGYKVNWSQRDDASYSALPLLAFAKVMLDWYYPSAYAGSSAYYAAEALFTRQQSTSLNKTDLDNLFNVCYYSSYDTDFFVNQWDNPVGPNTLSSENNISLLDVTLPTSSFKSSVTNSQALTTGTPVVMGDANGTVSSSPQRLSQYVIDALKSLTDFTTRHRLSGVRAIDRYLSEYNIRLSDEILKRSSLVGRSEFDLEFYDVLSHSDTSSQGGSPLGAYAGKGNAFNDSKFDIDNFQEFGIVIIVNTIAPQVSYYQGVNREVMHISPLDFYRPDFDHLSVQATSVREVYVPLDGSNAGAHVDSQREIFGFAPRYSEYNIPQSCQSGLYVAKSQSGLLPFYSLMRDLSALFRTSNPNQIKHSISFVQGRDSAQYNRLFFYVGQDNRDVVQNFNAMFRFNVTNYDTTLDVYDTYEFKHDNNQKVDVDVNGSKLN